MTVIIPVPDTGPTRRQIVELMFGQCGISGYEFGLTPEEVADALANLNAMMFEEPWNALGFIQPSYGVGDPEESSGLPFNALSAVALCLANRFCSTRGKTLSASQQAEMQRSRLLIASQYATMRQMPFARNTPRGAGGERDRIFLDPFINEDVDTLFDSEYDPGDLAGLV